MPTNPYEPSSLSDVKLDDATTEDRPAPEAPRYERAPHEIDIAIDREAALRIVESCQQVPVSDSAPTREPTTPKSSPWLTLVIAGMLVGLLLFKQGSDANSSPDPSASNFEETLSDPSWLSTLCPTAAVTIVLLALLLYWWQKPRAAKSDPPIWNATKLTLNEQSFAVQTSNRRGLNLRWDFAYSATQVSECEEAWVLYGEFNAPIVLLKDKIVDQQDQRIFSSFLQGIVDYQTYEQIAMNLREIDFSSQLPTLPDTSCKLQLPLLFEARARRKAGKILKADLPHFKAGSRAVRSPKLLRTFALMLLALLIFAPMLLSFLVGPVVFTFVGVVAVIALVFILWLWMLSREIASNPTATCYLDIDRLVQQFGATRVTWPLDEYPVRRTIMLEGVEPSPTQRQTSQAIVIATRNGESTFVLPDAAFDNADEFVTRFLRILEEDGVSTSPGERAT